MCRRSRRRRLERIISVFGLYPWRCATCELRFFAGLVPIKYFALVHCPTCGNLDVEHVRKDRVVGGMWITLQRLMKFPAYRCDACRTRFFSLRRYHPVEPTVWPEFTSPVENQPPAIPDEHPLAEAREPAAEVAAPALDDPARHGLS